MMMSSFAAAACRNAADMSPSGVDHPFPSARVSKVRRVQKSGVDA